MVFDNLPQIAWFIFLGLLGGVSYVIVNGKNWEDLGTFESCKRYILGGVIGLLYTILYSDLLAVTVPFIPVLQALQGFDRKGVLPDAVLGDPS